MDLQASAARTIEHHALIPNGASVLVALSGGPDSTALLHCLKSLGYTIKAAHLNHQFRGDESDGDERYVRDLCAELDIHLTVASIDVPKIKLNRRTTAQQAARDVRYEFLERTRTVEKLDLIATAHNSDDRVETILLNIIRGTGTDGLKGIPYRRGVIIRPLLDTPRSLVDTYNKVHRITPRFDSSNNLTKYARNSVRAELLPLLEHNYNPSVRSALLRLSDVAADESEYLSTVAKDWLGGRQTVDVTELLAEPIALQRRVLREWFRINVKTELSDVSHHLIEQFRLRMTGPACVTFPTGEFVAVSDGETASIRPVRTGDDKVIGEILITQNQDLVFGDLVVTVTAIGSGIDAEQLYVRQWVDGDRITLTGGTKKVQDVFTDLKIPRATRRVYPIICDQHGIIAVGDLKYAARAVGTRAILQIVRGDICV